MNQIPDSPLVQLAKAFEAFPANFLSGFLVALLIHILTDTIVMFLVAGCIVLGFLTSALVGIGVFFLAYTFLLTITQIATSINLTGQRIGAALTKPPSIPTFGQHPMGPVDTHSMIDNVGIVHPDEESNA